MFSRAYQKLLKMSDDKFNWCKLFTVEPEGKVPPSQTFPEASAILDNLPKMSYKKKKIKKTKTEFLMELFNDATTMPAYYALFDFLHGKIDLLQKDAQAFECLTVHMLRALVIYVEAFAVLFQERKISEKLAKGVVILNVFMHYPTTAIPQIEPLINSVFEPMLGLDMTQESADVWGLMEGLSDAIMEAMSRSPQHFWNLKSTQLVLLYAWNRASVLTKPDFKKESLVKLISIMHSLRMIPQEICEQYFEEIPVQIGVFVHWVISLVVFFDGEWTVHVSEVYRFASYCFTELVTLAGKIERLPPELEKRGFYDALAKFIYWSADLYPAFKIETTTTTFDPEEMKMVSPEWIELTHARKPPVMEFTRKTFDKGIEPIAKTVFPDRTETEYPDDCLKPFIEAQQVYKMVRLFDEKNHAFLSELLKKLVANVGYRIADDDKNGMALRYYILVCIFISMPPRVASQSFAQLRMADILVRLFVFDPQYSFVSIAEKTDERRGI